MYQFANTIWIASVIGGRKRQQDSAAGNADTIAIADGIGSHEYSDCASAVAVNAAMLNPSYTEKDIKQALMDSAPHPSGTTLTTAHIDPMYDSLEIRHVGDTRAWLWWPSDNDLELITTDHNLWNETPEEDEPDEGSKHILTRAYSTIGSETPGAETTTMQLNHLKPMWLLLTTDGVDADLKMMHRLLWRFSPLIRSHNTNPNTTSRVAWEIIDQFADPTGDNATVLVAPIITTSGPTRMWPRNAGAIVEPGTRQVVQGTNLHHVWWDQLV